MIEIELEPMALPAMQRAHEEERALYLQLARAVAARRAGEADHDAIDAILSDLLDHMTRHFGEEDRMMFEAGFPPYPAHSAEHRQVLEEVAASIARWQQTRDLDALAGHLLDRHLAWMKRHVATMDYLTARYLAMAEVAQRRPL